MIFSQKSCSVKAIANDQTCQTFNCKTLNVLSNSVILKQFVLIPYLDCSSFGQYQQSELDITVPQFTYLRQNCLSHGCFWLRNFFLLIRCPDSPFTTWAMETYMWPTNYYTCCLVKHENIVRPQALFFCM